EGAFGRADLVMRLARWDYAARTEVVQQARAHGVLQVWPTDPPVPTPPGVRHLRAQPLDALRAILKLQQRDDSSSQQTSAAEQEAARAAVARETLTHSYDGVHPLRLAEAVRRRLGPGDVITLDGGEFCQWIRLGLAWGPWATLINGKFGPIGTAVPHALGARVALGDGPAI